MVRAVCCSSNVHPPGVYELRYFTGLGYEHLRGVSKELLVSANAPTARFAWFPVVPVQNLAELTHSAGKVIALSTSKEVCTCTLPRNLAQFRVRARTHTHVPPRCS